MTKSKEKAKLQWHPGFFAAIQIEFREEAQYLEFESEHELGKKPMRIDTVVIKKTGGRPIRKNIGRIFRKYNLIEYKEPDDYLSINDFYKVFGYACFYQSDTEKVHEIGMDEITITFVCNHYPREMLRLLRKERGIESYKVEPGIYRLKNERIPIQIIINHELSEEENRWLYSLRNNLNADETANRLLEEYEEHKQSNLYQAAMDLIIRANAEMMKEVTKMCDALDELIREIAEERAEKMAETRIKEIMEERVAEQVAETELVAKISKVQKKCAKNKTIDTIADEMEEEVDSLEQIYRMVLSYPEESTEQIRERLKVLPER